MLGTEAVPEGVRGDHVEDGGEAGQELRGGAAGHLGPVVRPSLSCEVAGSEEDSGGQVAGGDSAVPGLNRLITH